MSLDITLIKTQPCAIYEDNITHNLNEMAEAAGLYEALWYPEKIDAKDARDIIPFLRAGLAKLRAQPDHFRQYNPSNGWGSYEGLVEFVKNYLAACEEYPDAKIEVSR